MLREIKERSVPNPEHISMNAFLLNLLNFQLKGIPEFQNDVAQAILDRMSGTIEAIRHDGKKILRFTRGSDAVNFLIGAKKHNMAEKQKTLTLSPSLSKPRLPVFEYEEAETDNPYDIPRRKIILHAGSEAFERGKIFIVQEVRRFK